MVFGLGLLPSAGIGLLSVVVLVYAAEQVIDRLTGIAEYYDIPDVIIAVSVVSIGTSLPELMSHMVASAGILSGTLQYEIASATVLGANIGSNVVQQTFIVGTVVLAFVFFGQEKVFQFDERFLKLTYLPMIGVHLMTLVLAWDGVLSRLDGMVLFGSFLAYMYFRFATQGERLNHDTEPSDSVRHDAAVAVFALAAVLGSAHVLLEVTEGIVAATGLGGSIIGVMTLGIASALPELFTAIEGIRQKASGIALGTLIGSNITNPLLAIGLGAVVSEYWVPRPLVLWDLPMEVVTATLLLGYLLFVSDRKLGFWGSIYLIGLYAGYVVVRFLFFAVD